MTRLQHEVTDAKHENKKLEIALAEASSKETNKYDMEMGDLLNLLEQLKRELDMKDEELCELHQQTPSRGSSIGSIESANVPADSGSSSSNAMAAKFKKDMGKFGSNVSRLGGKMVVSKSLLGRKMDMSKKLGGSFGFSGKSSGTALVDGAADVQHEVGWPEVEEQPETQPQHTNGASLMD